MGHLMRYTTWSDMKKKFLFYFLLLSMAMSNSCTDLQEQYDGNLTVDQVKKENIDNLLVALNSSLKFVFQNPFGNVIGLSEITTDELIVPTRGSDWGDNGVFRQLHQHQWGPEHTLITQCFNDLGGIVFATTNILQFNPSIQQKAKVRFFRAWAMYWMLDFFDQVPYRDPGESTLIPARVRKGLEALDYIIREINDIMGDLPDGPASEPNKNAAKVFLMKCYLNKGVYTNRKSPSFVDVDMNKVVSLADEILNSNLYTFSNNYFDNFAPDNASLSEENIFTQDNQAGQFDGVNLLLYMVFPQHYHSVPFGPNGFATLSDFYDKFEPIDLRHEQVYKTPNCPPNPGNRINMGFLVGQQYNLFIDAPLTDRKGYPLIFTRDVKIIETGANLEVTGIRPLKYAFDWTYFETLDNDWVYLRFPDVLLMKAEAIMRGGAPTSAGSYGSTALELVNAIRQHPSRGASPLTSVNFDILLDERGRELWLECWRRQDLIRFGKFLDPIQEKDYISDSRSLIFPIPNQQIGVNKNLTQNPGY